MRTTIRNQSKQRGFTLVEMLMATVVVIVGLVAVAQLVPTSVMMNMNNRNDGTALVFAQRAIEFIREQPLTSATNPPSFTDPLGVLCPLGQSCLLGDPTQPNVMVGSNLNTSGTPIVDFSATPVTGYSYTYIDPNDPYGAAYDVRWAISTTTGTGGIVTGRRIILGVFRRGMKSTSLPVTLDTLVEK
jgi:type II secretory pathway pseudopilin PulG